MAHPTEIVIHDNGSDDESTLALLEYYEESGIEVVRRGKISEANDLNSVNDSVEAYFGRHPLSRYAVTDCDIEISNVTSLAVYDVLLDMFPEADCVGPMLRISDIPRHYPLFNHVMNRHIAQFWRHRPQLISCKFGTLGIQRAQIDTTFAVHRSELPFLRKRNGIRVYAPYDARHMDWYLTADEMFASKYFRMSSAAISHWSNHQGYMEKHEELLRFKGFFNVACPDGRELAVEYIELPSR